MPNNESIVHFLAMQPPPLTCTPIGYFFTEPKSCYELPRQSGVQCNSGKVVLQPDLNFEQALADLEGFTRIWLIYWFHEKKGWKPKVQPPRGGKKRGVFATRSPHRPNPIGISSVRLIKIAGRTLIIEGHDLLNETPILDIKPYIPYADAHPDAKSGWLDDVELFEYELLIDEHAGLKNDWLKHRAGIDLLKAVLPILQHNPHPSPSNRIKLQKDNSSILAFKTWRIHFTIDQQARLLRILNIQSGYSHETITTSKQGNDQQIQNEFLNNFIDKN